MTDEKQTPQVEQLKAERANAEAYGNQTRIDAIDKQLKELGVAAKRKAAAEEKKPEEPKKTAPEGRSSSGQQKHTS